MTAYLPSLAGGSLIGLSAALLLLVTGRIAGISGIVGGLLATPDRDTPWRIVFLVGLLFGPLVYALAMGHWPVVRLDTSWTALIAGGLLVGFGARLGSGCTSGHGVCGLARLSRRSIAAVVTFMICAAVTVFLTRHGLVR